jgi:hypothetical protein
LTRTRSGLKSVVRVSGRSLTVEVSP